jgi:hypothetical protein
MSNQTPTHILTSISEKNAPLEMSIFEVLEDEKGYYVVVKDNRSLLSRNNEGIKFQLSETRIYFDLNETEPYPKAPAGHRFHRKGLDMKDSIQVEI